jgi:hypothetical protein
VIRALLLGALVLLMIGNLTAGFAAQSTGEITLK